MLIKVHQKIIALAALCLEHQIAAHWLKEVSTQMEFVNIMNPNEYPVYPEDDGYDLPKNPYSPV